MDILDSIFQKWNKDKDIESLISEGLFSNQSAIQASLEKLSGHEREKAFNLLEEIQTVLQEYISRLDEDKNTIKKQMNKNLKSEKACLSYGSSIDIQNKGKE